MCLAMFTLFIEDFINSKTVKMRENRKDFTTSYM